MTDRTIANDSGSTLSTWMTEQVPSFAPDIPDDARPDVCVIGAGIAGLSVAHALIQDGLDVLVLDQGPIGGGQTARTSAHLASALDDYFHVLERRFGKHGARLCYESHAAAIDTIERNVHALGIECEFRRVDGYLFEPLDDPQGVIAKEFRAAQRAGLGVYEVDRAPLPFDTGPCLRFRNQAEFHPLKYLTGIANAIVMAGGKICTGVHVVGVKGGTPVEIELATGRMLRATAVVDATQMTITSAYNIPLREGAYRTYCLGFEIERGYVPHGLYWDTLDPYHYIRVANGDGYEVLIVGGEDHRVAHGDPESHFPRLEAWVRERFPDAGQLLAAWSGQIQEPVDGMAYIGHLPGHENVYVVSGDSGNGLTHGVVASLLLPALIGSRKHPWRHIYTPSRSRLRAPSVTAHEWASSAGPYADWFRGGDVDSLDDIPPGHGATIRCGLHMIAAYKDERGQCHLRNARCPHLSAVLHWNEVEKTWDCPAHGSRFSCMGEVLNGPAKIGMDEPTANIDAPTRVTEPVLGDEPYPMRLA